jgi:hypothetical protein
MQMVSRANPEKAVAMSHGFFIVLFLLGVFVDPEDEGDTFLEKVGKLLSNYMALQLRR